MLLLIGVHFGEVRSTYYVCLESNNVFCRINVFKLLSTPHPHVHSGGGSISEVEVWLIWGVLSVCSF